MKLCITATGENLEAAVDPRFGRCQYFIFVDSDTLEFKAVKNPNIDTRGGAGIQSGQLVAAEKVEAVLTGNVGPNASETLNALGIKVFVGASGTVRDAVRQYKEGSLKQTTDPSVQSHFGNK
ncbi:dinitrogenase iron-molybdenum cofactor biosynthesis protein [candidate division WOR-1 bacterium RIFOXYA12_FULL_43_27]|uniref:Dinitrogenase iron-molybdenum cofactor biosynthesis protein n=1 Tax=candidate division WOR-1 bacterium RIFOXYC2_FULL_46_14 TaxID=1802587 RepID=A0A1F4U796_UNCSA|nr:MAG: dinitrogenase iron-molybdenum cofactor biosynthesis protein [candidate division WOR-1 bacterium RIFOXYA12_FULL_43_27]OGC19244.1 MAG: dinitrogenase iron-molybdenum cofactor biosynthesis protein [candidate division WOR-1 bacterium RIFOXYB2_FULL_46_45]OGC30233.1 MAG: dinitrogenase iron-molybdenum cofactor biosynthesis protein [candidate division WOR-1 bacterium RIFOXYA2_FULL_46_56]OGC40834.1 MAG: dinitrogenase iron-molybdenum cofactor biosynthesis protein [candidate division WOR-1 bacterium